jgi:hypothetical protein
MSRIRDNTSGYVQQVLVDLLADDSAMVREAAAAETWRRSPGQMTFAIRCLRDETVGNPTIPVTWSTIGPDKARQALSLLVESAPNEQDRERIRNMIHEEVGFTPEP